MQSLASSSTLRSLTKVLPSIKSTLLKHLERHFPLCASQDLIFATARAARVVLSLGIFAEGKCFQNWNPFLPWWHIVKGAPWLGTSLSVQFSSVAQSCPTLCDPMNRSTPGLPVHHQLPEFTQTHVHRVGDAIQPSHPRSSPPPPAPNPSQHQSLFQWVNSSHEVAKVLEFQL